MAPRLNETLAIRMTSEERRQYESFLAALQRNEDIEAIALSTFARVTLALGMRQAQGFLAAVVDALPKGRKMTLDDRETLAAAILRSALDGLAVSYQKPWFAVVEFDLPTAGRWLYWIAADGGVVAWGARAQPMNVTAESIFGMNPQDDVDAFVASAIGGSYGGSVFVFEDREQQARPA